MNVGLYHPWLKGKGGAEKVILETARKTEHNLTVYTLYYDKEATFSEFEEVNIQVLGENKEPGSFIDKGLRFGLGAMTRKIPTQELDALIVSEAGLGSLITFRNHDIPVLCYCHTPLRPALPEFKETYLEEQSTLLKPVYSLGLKFYSLLEKTAWKHFDHVTANSETTKNRIINKSLAKDVSVINPGADVENNQHQEYGDYFFYPSRFRRYKRQDLAIQAFKEANLDNFKLVLAGSGQEPEFIEELEEMSNEKIEIETDVSGERWNELYSNAYSVLFLAEKEDWGIIPVEAASFSKPIIAVDEGGPQESVKDNETGFLIEANSEAIAEKMSFLADRPEKVKEMGEKAKEHSKQYSWNNFSQKLDEKVDSLVK